MTICDGSSSMSNSRISKTNQFLVTASPSPNEPLLWSRGLFSPHSRYGRSYLVVHENPHFSAMHRSGRTHGNKFTKGLLGCIKELDSSTEWIIFEGFLLRKVIRLLDAFLYSSLPFDTSFLNPVVLWVYSLLSWYRKNALNPGDGSAIESNLNVFNFSRNQTSIFHELKDMMNFTF